VQNNFTKRENMKKIAKNKNSKTINSTKTQFIANKKYHSFYSFSFDKLVVKLGRKKFVLYKSNAKLEILYLIYSFNYVFCLFLICFSFFIIQDNLII
jgi:hypothetical protein